jgi:phosphomevalonate kinase
MNSRRFFAPGKVVLLGEYAVLDGAPALVAAIDRGVRCDVSPADALVIETPADDRFVRAALTAIGAPHGRYHFADHNPAPTPSKAGIGGSAAATVAAIVAGASLAGRPLDASAVHRAAVDVHQAVQGGGSGVDVAAAAHGGVIRFQAGEVRAHPPITPWLAFSGTSASTGPRVQRYLSWSPREAFTANSARLVDAFDLDPIAALNEAGDRLGEMAAAAGIEYWTDGLRRLVDSARAVGGGAKPSGAGGGDVVVALFPDPDRAMAWHARATADGFVMIPTRLAPAASEVPHA